MYIKNNANGDIGKSVHLQDGYSLATQEEIDAYILTQDKKIKLRELKDYRYNFCVSGFSYNGNTFDLEDVLSIFEAKESNRNKFFNLNSAEVDFTDTAGFDSFKSALLIEKDRIMVKYHNYKKKIDDCATSAAINAITIDFSV